MQIKIFSIPLEGNTDLEEELNKFLRSHKVLHVQQELIKNSDIAYWSFCVRYVFTSEGSYNKEKGKKDYKQILDAKTFEKFSQLREIRKEVSKKIGLAAFIIFTDAELAQMAALETLTKKGLLAIPGIGEKKVEKYASYFIEKEKDTNEKEGISN